jgi:hypothetical protein
MPAAKCCNKILIKKYSQKTQQKKKAHFLL